MAPNCSFLLIWFLFQGMRLAVAVTTGPTPRALAKLPAGCRNCRASSDLIICNMHQGPGMDCVTPVVSPIQDNSSNVTNGSAVSQTSLAGATIASPISMFLAGVIGNILALLILQRTRRESQRLMFHGLVAGLVWNDLVGIVLTSPVTIVSYINGLQMPGGEHLCRFNGFVMVCFGISTPLIVSAMAIERFLFVRYTFFYTKHCAPGAARMVVVLIWAFVLFFGLLPLFGFGSYVLQYPRTWCFLDFRATDPIHVSYGYIYALLNMLLVVVMVVCNLVVVATLARVRDFRRKHSTSSLNSVLIGDNVLDETAKVQAMARRRKQKDIELHMIVVMCAITTIFAVCWVPLMIYIMMSLASVCNTDHVLGLVAIRMASLNQTLNPWLYVILRRSLIIRLKKYCCQWKRCLQRKKSSAHPHPTGRRQQYVHVRNQLCHRNNFVGGLDGLGSEAMSDSVRQSLQKAIPGALSLPDVMMVNTGRRELDLPYSDIAKAQSFAGRVSHSYSPGSVVFCAYCEAPSIYFDVCSECIRHRQKDKETSLNLPDRSKSSKISGQNREFQAANSVRDEKLDLRHRNGRIRYVNKSDSLEDVNTNVDCDKIHNDDSVGGLVMSCGRETTSQKDGHKDKSKPNRELTGGVLQSSIRSGSIPSRANSKGFDPRPSQHSTISNKPPRGSKSSASVKSSKSSSLSKSRPSSLNSASQDTGTHSSSDGPARRWARTESGKSGKCTSPNDCNDVFSNDSKEGDEHLCEFHDEDEDETFEEDHRDTTTDDDGMFSFPQTESIYLSESTNSQTSKPIHANHTKEETSIPISPKAYPINREGATCSYIRHNKTDSLKGMTKSLDKGSNRDIPTHVTNGNDLNAVPPTTAAATLSTQCVNVRPQNSGYINSKSYMNPGFDRFSSDISSLVRDNSDDEGSSGIFSAESPAHVSRRSVDIPFFKKESRSDVDPSNKAVTVKEQARKVKSYH